MPLNHAIYYQQENYPTENAELFRDPEDGEQHYHSEVILTDEDTHCPHLFIISSPFTFLLHDILNECNLLTV